MPSPEELDDPSRLPAQADVEEAAHATELPVPDPDLPETIINTVNEDKPHIAKCFRCDATEFLALCRHCGHEFCGNHRSKYSDQYCYLCIAPSNLGLEFLPLEEESIDDVGQIVTHHGRRIKLIGEGWPNNMQMVNSLDDAGLEIFIAERQRLLKEAVATAEYHRITLSHAEFTKEYKRHSKAAKLQRRYTELQQGSVRLSGKTHKMGGTTKKQLTEDEKLQALLGLDAEQFKAFKKVMNKI